MKVNKIRLTNEYDNIFYKIKSNENFVLFRYGDGEYSIMNGIAVSAQEGWKSPNEVSDLGLALKESLSLDDEKVYYGISCPCCDRTAYYWYMTNIKSRNITFANMFVNYNYRRFISDFEKIEREAIIIANHKGKNNKIGNLNIIKYYEVGDDCISFWKNEASELINLIKDEYGDRKNLLYVVSAGPMSEPIIYELFKNNPDNCYIDFGSAIDCYIHQRDTRPYTDISSVYGKRNCWMFNPRTTDFNVSVVLNTYKKPDALKKQLEAVCGQTLKPKEILLFKDGIEDDYNIEFGSEVLEQFTDVRISQSNVGVWERFKYAMKCNSDYICIFDDDTIPGKRWLENCHFHMMKKEGIYGTVGIILKRPNGYPHRDYKRVGWPRPFSKTVEVDFVGHSWFLKKNYLDYMFDDTEKYQEYKYVGEDMCLSFMCKKHGISTFVPPHPHDNEELWGSIPTYALKYGNASTALYLNDNNSNRMNDILKEFNKEGWDLVYNRKKKEIDKANVLIEIEKDIHFTKLVYKKVKRLIKG